MQETRKMDEAKCLGQASVDLKINYQDLLMLKEQLEKPTPYNIFDVIREIEEKKKAAKADSILERLKEIEEQVGDLICELEVEEEIGNQVNIVEEDDYNEWLDKMVTDGIMTRNEAMALLASASDH
jgi:hypothetical protein